MKKQLAGLIFAGFMACSLMKADGLKGCSLPSWAHKQTLSRVLHGVKGAVQCCGGAVCLGCDLMVFARACTMTNSLDLCQEENKKIVAQENIKTWAAAGISLVSLSSLSYYLFNCGYKNLRSACGYGQEQPAPVADKGKQASQE